MRREAIKVLFDIRSMVPAVVRYHACHGNPAFLQCCGELWESASVDGYGCTGKYLVLCMCFLEENGGGLVGFWVLGEVR